MAHVQQQKGVSLIITLLVMTVMLAIVLGISTIVFYNIKTIGNMGDSVSSFNGANEGLQKVLYYDRKVTTVNGVTLPRGLCAMCAPSNPTCTAPDCVSCNETALAAGGCDPATCNNCKVTFNSSIDNRNYAITAQVDPNDYLAATSTDTYNNAIRTIGYTCSSSTDCTTSSNNSSNVCDWAVNLLGTCTVTSFGSAYNSVLTSGESVSFGTSNNQEYVQTTGQPFPGHTTNFSETTLTPSASYVSNFTITPTNGSYTGDPFNVTCDYSNVSGRTPSGICVNPATDTPTNVACITNTDCANSSNPQPTTYCDAGQCDVNGNHSQPCYTGNYTADCTTPQPSCNTCFNGIPATQNLSTNCFVNNGTFNGNNECAGYPLAGGGSYTGQSITIGGSPYAISSGPDVGQSMRLVDIGPGYTNFVVLVNSGPDNGTCMGVTCDSDYRFGYNYWSECASTQPAFGSPITGGLCESTSGCSNACSTGGGTNGVCGSANGVAVSSAPKNNLCSVGTPSKPTGSGPWNWTCAGSGGGSTASCSAPVSSGAVNGVCGSANGTAVSSAPTTNLCSVGTASSVTGSGPWNWTCAGSGGGSTASCSAPVPSCNTCFAYPGSQNLSTNCVGNNSNNTYCGSYPIANGGNGYGGQSFTVNYTNSTITSGPADNGANIRIVEIGPGYTNFAIIINSSSTSDNGKCFGLTCDSDYKFGYAGWTQCAPIQPALGSAIVTNKLCESTSGCSNACAGGSQAINGTCGSANRTAVASAPTTNLCASGTASSVSGNGPWNWTCAGSGGGSTANCSASFCSANAMSLSGNITINSAVPPGVVTLAIGLPTANGISQYITYANMHGNMAAGQVTGSLVNAPDSNGLQSWLSMDVTIPTAQGGSTVMHIPPLSVAANNPFVTGAITISFKANNAGSNDYAIYNSPSTAVITVNPTCASNPSPTTYCNAITQACDTNGAGYEPCATTFTKDCTGY